MTRNAALRRFSDIVIRCALPILVLAAVASRPAAAGEHRFSAALDGPVIVGGQLFSGASLGVTVDGGRELIAIDIEGRRVALAFASGGGSIRAEAGVDLVFRRDADGVLALSGLRSSTTTFGGRPPRTNRQDLVFVAVCAGSPAATARLAGVLAP